MKENNWIKKGEFYGANLRRQMKAGSVFLFYEG
jgi:hypothetical protein